jgi:hypothetical protein
MKLLRMIVSVLNYDLVHISECYAYRNTDSVPVRVL